MTATERYIRTLMALKSGELSLLRRHADQGLDTTLHGFDLFTGLWWPLRQRDPTTPRREVAWLIAKLYAAHPIPQSEDTLAHQLRRCRRNSDRERFEQRFDTLLSLPLDRIEPTLRWALGLLASGSLRVNWVRLTDDLSIWERESTRLKWAEQYLDERRT